MIGSGLCLTAKIPDDKIIRTYKTKISVVIPTYNAGDDFPELLGILSRQRGIDSVQIIIVDSGSSDETVDTAKWFRTDLIEIPNERFSHSYARNLGAAKADGDYILFMTQDAMPVDDFWMYRLVSVLEEHPDIAALSPVELPNGRGDLKYCADQWYHYKHMDVLDSDKITSLPKEQKFWPLRYCAVLCDVTCLIRRDIYMQFPYEGDFAEDLRLALALLRAGYKEAHISSVGVFHSHSRAIGYYMKRSFTDSRTVMPMFDDYPCGNNTKSAMIGNMFASLRKANGLIGQIEKTLTDKENLKGKLDGIINNIESGGIEEGDCFIPDDFVTGFLDDIKDAEKDDSIKYLTFEVVADNLKNVLFPYVLTAADGYDAGKLKKDIADSIYKIYAAHIGGLMSEYARWNEGKDEWLAKWMQILSKGV